MKKVIPYFLLLIPLFTSGCFSMMTDGNGWEGRPTTGERVQAAAMDVVTLPIQAPFLLAMGADTGAGPSKATQNSQGHRTSVGIPEISKSPMTLLEEDPSIAIKENWDELNSPKRDAFIASFSNPKVKYTTNMVEDIYRTLPDLRRYLYRSQSCSPKFLAAHFDEAYQRSIHSNYDELASIVSNPNTPLELVEKVASSKKIPMAAVYPAREILKKRYSEQTQPAADKPITNSTDNPK